MGEGDMPAGTHGARLHNRYGTRTTRAVGKIANARGRPASRRPGRTCAHVIYSYFTPILLVLFNMVRIIPRRHVPVQYSYAQLKVLFFFTPGRRWVEKPLPQLKVLFLKNSVCLLRVESRASDLGERTDYRTYPLYLLYPTEQTSWRTLNGEH